jgi:hypothetical protein
MQKITTSGNRPRKEHLQPAWRGRKRPCSRAQDRESCAVYGRDRAAAAVPCRDGGLFGRTRVGAPDPGSGSRRPNHGAAVCRALSQEWQELAEFGMVLPQRALEVRRGAAAKAEGLPGLAGGAVVDLLQHLGALDERISAYDRQLEHLAQASEPARRLMSVPGVGPLTASATVASIGAAHEFCRSRRGAAITRRWWRRPRRMRASSGQYSQNSPCSNPSSVPPLSTSPKETASAGKQVRPTPGEPDQ